MTSIHVTTKGSSTQPCLYAISILRLASPDKIAATVINLRCFVCFVRTGTWDVGRRGREGEVRGTGPGLKYVFVQVYHITVHPLS